GIVHPRFGCSLHDIRLEWLKVGGGSRAWRGAELASGTPLSGEVSASAAGAARYRRASCTVKRQADQGRQLAADVILAPSRFSTSIVTGAFMPSFEDIGLREELLRTLEEEEIDQPTALQEAVLPTLRRGGNLVA